MSIRAISIRFDNARAELKRYYLQGIQGRLLREGKIPVPSDPVQLSEEELFKQLEAILTKGRTRDPNSIGDQLKSLMSHLNR